MAVYGYCRVSTMAQADDGESLDVQQRQLQGWAMMKGAELSDMFVERGVSGSDPVKSRPEGGRLWKTLRKGDTVVACKLDRVFRNALDALQMVEELKAKGVALVLLDLGAEPVTNGISKLFLTIAAAFAEAERDRIRERISQAKADGRARGRYLGGKVPFGYRVEDGGLVEVEAEQEAIDRIMLLRAEGRSLRAIREIVTKPDGSLFAVEVIAQIVNRANKVERHIAMSMRPIPQTPINN